MDAGDVELDLEPKPAAAVRFKPLDATLVVAADVGVLLAVNIGLNGVKGGDTARVVLPVIPDPATNGMRPGFSSVVKDDVGVSALIIGMSLIFGDDTDVGDEDKEFAVI